MVRFVVAAIVFISFLAASLAAQTRPHSKPKQPSVRRTPEGDPDLQGIWNPTTQTPLERPTEFAAKATVTDQEARAYETKDHRDIVNVGDPELAKAQQTIDAYDSDFWDDAPQLARVNGVKRTSLIIDPPDGKLPPRTSEGKKRIALISESFSRYDKVQDRPLSERCVSDSEVPIIPFGVYDNIQIIQVPGSIMILSEVIHDARIVRMNGTHLPSNIRLSLGDSIGHWAGKTLVVDTTNFNNQMAARGTGEQLHVLESFTRIDPNTVLYRATVEDPGMFTKPWTIEFPLIARSKPIFEYACHEGNYALPGILAGARKSESALAK